MPKRQYVNLLAVSSKTRTVARLLLAFLLIAFLASASRAHDPQLSSVKIIHQAPGSVVVSVGTHISRLHATDLDTTLRTRLKLRLDGRVFTPTRTLLIKDTANDMVTWQSPYAGPAAQIEVQNRLYPEDPTSRFIVAEIDQGAVVKQAVLDDAHPSVIFAKDVSVHEEGSVTTPPSSFWSVVGAFVLQGVQHIWGGPDHICFVLGLLLLGGSVARLLKTVTAFTLAHSITLTLAASGIVSPPPRFVEPLIALSIVAIAVENGRCCKRDTSASAVVADKRPLLAFGFGLIHGFGFAGALREVGLPTDAIAPALASLNVGVEIGQIAIVLSVAPLIALLARKAKRAHRFVVLYGSVAIATAGVCWFVQRVLNVG